MKESRKEPLFKETLPYYLQRLDAIAKENNGHLAVGRVRMRLESDILLAGFLKKRNFFLFQLTWADLYFVAILDYVNSMAKTDIIEGYPNLQAVRNNVLAIPAIKSWVETRPQSDC